MAFLPIYSSRLDNDSKCIIRKNNKYYFTPAQKHNQAENSPAQHYYIFILMFCKSVR